MVDSVEGFLKVEKNSVELFVGALGVFHKKLEGVDVLLDQSPWVAELLLRDDLFFLQHFQHSECHRFGDDLPCHFQQGDWAQVAHFVAVLLLGNQADQSTQQVVAHLLSVQSLVGDFSEKGSNTVSESFEEGGLDS